MTEAVSPRPKDVRFAQVAAVLARAAMADEAPPLEVARVLRHELRKRNTNKALKVPRRSKGAQAVIDEFAARGEPIPKNGSMQALHCDHVWTITLADLERLQTPEAWLAELPRFDEVVCLTAAENYSLQPFEKAGATGWSKYDTAGVTLL